MAHPNRIYARRRRLRAGTSTTTLEPGLPPRAKTGTIAGTGTAAPCPVLKPGLSLEPGLPRNCFAQVHVFAGVVIGQKARYSSSFLNSGIGLLIYY